MSGCSLSMLCDVHSHHKINSALAFKKGAAWQTDLYHIAQPCILWKTHPKLDSCSMPSPKSISAALTIACLLLNVNAHVLSARKATSSPSNSTSNSTSGGTFNNARFTYYDVGL